MQEGDPREPKNNHPEKKEQRTLEGRRINPQLPCNPHSTKQKLKIQYHSKEPTEADTFRDMLSKRDRIKESHSKLEHRTNKRPPEQNCNERLHNKKSNSKSRSKSKGIIKSRSTKQLVKKSKSMIRLQPQKNQLKEERKSESPHNHGKSINSYADRKQLKSNFNSKTNRQFVSELTTEREKSKIKLKTSKNFKKPKIQTLKKGQNKSIKAKSQKQNSKAQKRPRMAKPKKDKKVLVSEENSKVRRDQQWEISLNEDQFLESKGHDQKLKMTKLKDSNIVDIPKRKERLSLNSSAVHRKVTLKNKTEVQIQSYRSRKRQIQNLAAITIQKVFRGYLTRKYIKQCFQYNAAINIQRIWRGYQARKQVKIMKKQNNKDLERESPKKEIDHKVNKIFEQQDYLLQKSSERSDLKSSGLNQRWASILEEILEEQSVNHNIKRKIQNFLQQQRKDLNQFELDASKSPSARSSISSQVINNQINSQRHFLAQVRQKKLHPNDQFILHSPNPYFSPRRMQYGSPQPPLGSPKSRLNSQSPPRSSAELLVANLKNIQQLHVDRLKNKANTQKQQLNSMLIKNKLSPRTHQKKYKQVDLNLECQLQKFNQSINQVVKNCIIYGQPDEIVPQTTLITPKKQLAQLQIPQQSSSPRHPYHPSQPQQISLQLRQYYETQSRPHQDTPQPFDTSYQFIQQYLINLIDYIRQTENGVSKVLSILFKPKSHQIDTILRNLKTVTQNSQQQQHQNSFRLPMYKYIDLEEEIIQNDIIQSFNQTFSKVQQNTLGNRNILQDNFIKMIADCMNQALNSLRPQCFPFVETNLNTLNSIKSLHNISLLEYQGSDQQKHYQFIFAQALNKIFYWNKLQWGMVIRYDQDTESVNQTKNYLMKLMEKSIVQLHSSEEWIFYEELIEILGNITDELFESIIFEEIATVWGTIIDWGENIGRSPIKIQPPNSKAFFEP